MWRNFLAPGGSKMRDPESEVDVKPLPRGGAVFRLGGWKNSPKGP